MKLNIVGKDIIRVDAKSKVTGDAIYPDDINMDKQAYAKTFRSTIPHANFKIDISNAEKIDGVLKIFTFKDLYKNKHGVVLKDHEVLCEKRVRRIGDPIAFVVAETKEICDKAIEKINIEYEELEPVFDPIYAMSEKAPRIHDDFENNIVHHFKIRKGDWEEGFKNSHIIVENTYKTQLVDHGFMQPESALSYIDEENRVTVVVATQYPHYDREEIASALGLEEDEVRVINTNVGGAFGGREDISMQIHMALAAKELQRPIKITIPREESFYAHSKRHPFIMNYKTGADKEGYLTAMEIEIIGDSGAYASWAINVLRKGGVHASGPYYVPNIKVDSIAVYTNNPYTGAKRGFGATQPAMAYEQQMDILAEKLGISPIEIRRKNIFKKGSETATGQILVDSVPIDRCLDAVIEGMKFAERGEKNA